MARIDPAVIAGIRSTARALGIDPVVLGTVISYETGGTFDPRKRGPRTKWGQHRGLIQFGEPQAVEYGVDWNDPITSQLGPQGAVVKYLRAHGVRPGMGLLDVYSAINAGGIGEKFYNRSDAKAGGAPGTVRDKVNNQMADHRRKAMRLLAGDGGAAQPQQPDMSNWQLRESVSPPNVADWQLRGSVSPPSASPALGPVPARANVPAAPLGPPPGRQLPPPPPGPVVAEVPNTFLHNNNALRSTIYEPAFNALRGMF